MFLKSDVEDPDKETDKEETKEDGEQKVEISSVICLNNDSITIDWGAASPTNGDAGATLSNLLAFFSGKGGGSVDVYLTSDISTPTPVTVPGNIKLCLYGSNIVSSGKKTWWKTGTGGNRSSFEGDLASSCLTTEIYDLNVCDFTSSEVNYSATAGCLSFGKIKAERCNFLSLRHWWSVCSYINGEFNDCKFDNTAGDRGYGGTSCWGNATFKNCSFVGKDGYSTSRALGYSCENNGSLNVSSCTFSGYSGGNETIGCNGNVVIKNCTITNSEAYYSKQLYEGIRYNGGTSGQKLYVENTTISKAKNNGIYCQGTVEIVNTTIYSCGNGIYNDSGTVTISGSNIYSNIYCSNHLW